MSTADSVWFRNYWQRPAATLQIFVFPHGGGAASFYRPLAKQLPADIEPLIVQYPGREDRLDERCLDDMASLADLITDALVSTVNRRFVMFGHSMGASVAFEVAYRLHQQSGLTPARLIVSGQPGPRFQSPGDKHLDDDALWAELSRLSGTDLELIASAQLRSLVLPQLRADYRLIESYRPPVRRKLPCPVTAWIGDADPDVEIEKARGWREATAASFDINVFPGDHFYFRDREPQVAECLARAAGVAPDCHEDG